MEVRADHLSFAYKEGKTILHDVSLEVKAGEILYVLGPNGGGKSTLLSCLAGLLQPDSGKVYLAEKPLAEFEAAERARLIGMIPQMHVPSFAYTVEEMVMMGRAPHLGWLESPSRVDYEIVQNALEQVGLLELKGRPYTEISGGERQLTLIARGLAQKCQILLMDEPSAHLDLSNQYRILEIIQQLSHKGLSFIITSHSPNDALATADRVLLLNNGWVTAYGPPDEVLTEALLSTVYGVRTEVIYETIRGLGKPRAVVPRRPETIDPQSMEIEGSLLWEVFEKRHKQSQLILVTGMSGAGKTTWCSRLVELARARGMSVDGILAPGIFEGQHKTGISVRNLKTGEEKQLAKLRQDDSGDISTPMCTFDPDVLDWANDQLGEIKECDLLIIDELGPLEFLRSEGLMEGMDLIDRQDFKAAFVVVRSSLLPNALQRWPDALVINGRI